LHAIDARQTLVLCGRRFQAWLGVAYEFVDRVNLFDLAIRSDTQLRKLPRTRQDLSFKGTYGAVKRVDALAEAASHFSEMTREYTEALVQVFGQITNGLGILRQRCLPPAICYRLE
jgi:pterin-4a-carbinolamine dehydratase